MVKKPLLPSSMMVESLCPFEKIQQKMDYFKGQTIVHSHKMLRRCGRGVREVKPIFIYKQI